MFSEAELIVIEELVTEYGSGWAPTRIEAQIMNSILDKIERELNDKDQGEVLHGEGSPQDKG